MSVADFLNVNKLMEQVEQRHPVAFIDEVGPVKRLHNVPHDRLIPSIAMMETHGLLKDV